MDLLVILFMRLSRRVHGCDAAKRADVTNGQCCKSR